jgi:hypothetical protein
MLGVSPFHHIYHHNKLKERYQYLERICGLQARDQTKKSARRSRNSIRLSSDSRNKLRLFMQSDRQVTDKLPDGTLYTSYCIDLIYLYWSEYKSGLGSPLEL